MSQTVLITLTSAGSGTGPFDLYCVDSNGNTIGIAFEQNVSKASLLAGYLSTQVPDGCKTIRVKSDNQTCLNYVDIPIKTTTTTTLKPTTSTTSSTSTTSTTTISVGPPPPTSSTTSTTIDPLRNVNLTVRYEVCNGLTTQGIFKFTLSSPLVNSLTLQQAVGDPSRLGVTNGSGTAYPIFPITIPAGTTTFYVPSTIIGTVPTGACTFTGNNLVYSALVYGSTTANVWTMPNGQIVTYTSVPTVGTAFTPSNNTVCLTTTTSTSTTSTSTTSTTSTSSTTTTTTQRPTTTTSTALGCQRIQLYLNRVPGTSNATGSYLNCAGQLELFIISPSQYIEICLIPGSLNSTDPDVLVLTLGNC